jgi:hypothetical protein
MKPSITAAPLRLLLTVCGVTVLLSAEKDRRFGSPVVAALVARELEAISKNDD